MNEDKRIEELEAQVRGLNDLLHRLLAEQHQSGGNPKETGVPELPPRPFAEGVRERMDKVMRTGPDETIESHIGAVWLSRVAVVILMTFIALLARETYQTEQFGALEKVLVGFGIAAAFMGYGFSVRKRQDLFAQAILGCGLAILYFTTYAAFFIPQMQIIPDQEWIGLGVLMICIGFIAGVSHWRRSETVAGISLFLAYYTVVVSCTQDPTLKTLTHALLTCTALAVVTFIFHFVHRWLLFTWAALIATHLSYIVFFLRKPPALDVSDHAYFWISNGFLAVCYVFFSLACVVDARKTGEYRKTVAPMAGVNSFVFFTLTWFAIRQNYVEYEWAFRSAFAVALLIFAVFAEFTGPKRNYLFQIFIAKTVIMLTLALQAYYSGEKLLVAMAIECLGLAFSYKRSGLVTFKALGLSLMLITFLGCLFELRSTGAVNVFGWSTPSNWFSAVGVASAFSVVAWFYERHVRRLLPEDRKVKGQWFLADSVLDWSSANLAMAHAAAGALLLLTITILDCGEDPQLPFLLACQGAIMAGVGLALRTPQIEIACVLLLSAAHVCFYVLLWMPLPGFEVQPHFARYTALLAGLTYVGAYAWERYLRRFRNDGRDVEHHAIAAIPYLVATVMLVVLLGRTLDPLHVPAANGALAMALFLAGSLTGFPAVKASAVLAMALATGCFYVALYDVGGSIATQPYFLPYLALFLATCAGAERMIALLQRRELVPSPAESIIRSLLVVLAVALGILGLFEWAPAPLFIFYLLGYAVIAISLGAFFRESRYRWAALFLLGTIIVWAFLQFEDSSPFIFGATAVVLLVVSWFYSRSGRRPPRTPGTTSSPGALPGAAGARHDG